MVASRAVARPVAVAIPRSPKSNRLSAFVRLSSGTCPGKSAGTAKNAAIPTGQFGPCSGGGTCNGNTFPQLYDPAGRFIFAGATINLF